MSYISAIQLPIASPITLALARAAQLDLIPVDDYTEKTLLDIGDAVGGVSRAGFHADLTSAIAAASQTILDDNYGVRISPYACDWREDEMVVAEQDGATDRLCAVEPWTGYVGFEQQHGNLATFAISVARCLDGIEKTPATEGVLLAIRDALGGVAGTFRCHPEATMQLGTNEEPVCAWLAATDSWHYYTGRPAVAYVHPEMSVREMEEIFA